MKFTFAKFASTALVGAALSVGALAAAATASADPVTTYDPDTGIITTHDVDTYGGSLSVDPFTGSTTYAP
jgi:hypothetical protein